MTLARIASALPIGLLLLWPPGLALGRKNIPTGIVVTTNSTYPVCTVVYHNAGDIQLQSPAHVRVQLWSPAATPTPGPGPTPTPGKYAASFPTPLEPTPSKCTGQIVTTPDGTHTCDCDGHTTPWTTCEVQGEPCASTDPLNPCETFCVVATDLDVNSLWVSLMVVHQATLNSSESDVVTPAVLYPTFETP